MSNSISNWFGQITTGAGFSGLMGVAAAVASGTMTWQHAVPLAVAALVSIAWPENSALAPAAEKLAADVAAAEPALKVDVETLINVFKAGMTHQASVAPVPTTTPAPTLSTT